MIRQAVPGQGYPTEQAVIDAPDKKYTLFCGVYPPRAAKKSVCSL
jgi:hypothetical protein